MKKLFIGIGLIVILALAYWLISPFWRDVTLDEALPGTPDASIQDNRQTMDAETQADFDKQTADMKDEVMVKDETMPASQPTITSRANMIAMAHGVEGEALLVTAGDETFLRFENLKTINGPDLRIYLSSDLNADDIVDLGAIRATEGSVNYAIPAGTDLTKYTNVMIWCRAFGVLFSYAQFK
ncbi:MAG: DM13 domain-containing protein [Patescibacteria group bacterium]